MNIDNCLFIDQALCGLDFAYAYINDQLINGCSESENLQHIDHIFNLTSIQDSLVFPNKVHGVLNDVDIAATAAQVIYIKEEIAICSHPSDLVIIGEGIILYPLKRIESVSMTTSTITITTQSSRIVSVLVVANLIYALTPVGVDGFTQIISPCDVNQLLLLSIGRGS